MTVGDEATHPALAVLQAGPNVADALDVWSRLQPGAVALEFAAESISFEDLAGRSRQVAQRLSRVGVGKGSRVGLLDLNTPAYFYLFFALARLGAVMVPINFRLAPPEIDFIVADAQLELLFVGAAFDTMVPGLTRVEHKSIVRLGQQEVARLWFDEWSETVSMSFANPAGDFLQLYTSGTTGHPKGVLIGHGQYLRFISALIIAGWGAYAPGHRQLVAMPMFHVAGLNVAILVLLQGGINVVLPAVDPEAILRTLAARNIQSTLMAPVVLQMMVQHPLIGELSFPCLEQVIYGASPISAALQSRVAEVFDCGLVQVYGMTENLGGGTFLSVEDHHPSRGLLRSCGKPYPGSDLMIVGTDGQPLAAGQVGEILSRSDWTMKGYWKRSEETRRTLAGGWLHTGDAAYMNEEGYVFIFDRVKEMIITGGENVYPAEVENVLAGFAGLSQVAVIGVPDDKWGEAVKAVVVMQEGVVLDVGAIHDYARQRLAGYKIPRTYDVVQALPTNATGKILKRTLRKQYWPQENDTVG